MAHHRFYHVTPAGELRPFDSPAGAFSMLSGGGYIWLDYFDPSRDQMVALVELLGLHPLAIEDCLDDDGVAKIEDFPNHTFLLINAHRYAENELAVEEVDFFLGANFLVSVGGHGGKGLCLADKVEKAIGHDRVNVGKGPDLLLHLMLDHIVDAEYPALEAVEEEIDAAEEGILQNASKFKLNQLAKLRRDLLGLRKSLFHEREILIKICRRDSPYITEQSIYHFRDIYDHLTKFFEEAEIYREMIVNLMEMYLSIINNQMAQVANKTNVTLRRLTFITTIFMPLTLLAGIGGMSEWSMMTGAENWQLSYPLFILLMVVIGAATYVFLRWLDRQSFKAAAEPLDDM